MSTPSTGQIKFSDMVSEFGQPPNKNLGGYRVSQSIAGRNWTLDSGVPTSGQIKFSDMMGKTLNVVVDLSGGEEYNVDTGAKYDSNGQAVGGFKSTPGRLSSSTKKVHVIVRKTVGGSLGDGVALRSGTWNTSALSLNYIITSSGEVIGKGGNGGSAGGAPGYGDGYQPALSTQTGQSGSPAVYLTYPCSVILESGGRIQGGGGGGGGAGSGCCNPDSNPQDPVATGGGGGGGAGLPAGLGGATGGSSGGITRSPAPGSNGSKYAGGSGGQGASTDGNQAPRDCAFGGGGGGGGGPTPGAGGDGASGRCGADSGGSGSSTSGGNGGRGNACLSGSGSRAGGPAGSNGYAVSYSSGIMVNVTNSGGTYFGGSGVL